MNSRDYENKSDKEEDKSKEERNWTYKVFMTLLSKQMDHLRLQNA